MDGTDAVECKRPVMLERSGLESQLCHLFAGHTHRNHTASQSLSFFFHEMEILTSTSELS